MRLGWIFVLKKKKDENETSFLNPSYIYVTGTRLGSANFVSSYPIANPIGGTYEQFVTLCYSNEEYLRCY